MPLPDIQKKQIEQKVGAFCESRVPQHVRHQVRLSYKCRGNSVIIIENRISYLDENEWIEIPVAQLRFNTSNLNWTLYCLDRNRRWHEYLDCTPTKNLDLLLQEIDEDPTGIFWG